MKGVLIALLIISLWMAHLIYILTSVEADFRSPLFYLHILIQAYLYTGLFITAHDAMHGIVTGSKKVNKVIGTISTFLFAGMSYKRLVKNHFEHHRYPGTEKDPDYYIKSQNFFVWWLTFMYRYTTIPQLIVMGVAYNVIKIWIPEINLWFFWIVPAFLGTLQLFFFGTYLPHRKPHLETMQPHNARTQKKNHLWAMLSCYFFGYHFEHHDAPRTPWWQLYKLKG
jgi:beta-carotene ketolase (CrtW type)